uniref:TNFR-Cys domain-containing protein n=1 Tax=Magallana gigas TaxID=29159 RepID=A0A8W8N8U6_MAGGI
MTRYWSILIVVVLFEQVHQVSTFCSPCHSDGDCHGHCSVSSHIPVCDWLTFFIIREHCCLCKAATCSHDADCSRHSCSSGYVSKCNSQRQCHCERDTSCTLDTDCSNHCFSDLTATCSNGQCHCQRGTCSSDADCLSQSCRNDSMSKCDTHNHCHCTQRPACGHGHDTDCRNLHCSSGFKGTCSNGHCHCQRESTQLISCSLNTDCVNYHCSSGRSPYCRTTILDGHCDCLECQVDSDCSQHCPHRYSRKCQSNRCDCLYDRASAHCSRNSDCVNLQCSSGHTPVCSLSTQSCHCQATCNTHHDCVHMTCRHGYSVCSASQNNAKTCMCQSTCSTQDECTNHDCGSHHKSYCQSGQCYCSRQCSSNSYCSSLYGYCEHSRSKPHCSTYLGNICVCKECVHDSECSNLHCQPYHSPICRNDSCSCESDPIDGVWSQWGSWSSCSVTCGPGRQTRARSCTNPAPAHGGLSCSGNSYEERSCSQVSSCRVDGGWSNWMAWSTCSVTCGAGMQTRARMCSNPVPSNGGSYCVGDVYQTQTCATAACGGLACPTCDNNLVCTFNNTCDSSETCMIRSYHGTRFTVHCSKKEDCAFMKSNIHGEIYCCDDHSCLQRYLGVA